jgi:hypothetical protein
VVQYFYANVAMLIGRQGPNNSASQPLEVLPDMRRQGARLLAAALAAAICSVTGGVPGAIAADRPAVQPEHDFDFELGRWHTDIKRLKEPLSHSSDWLSYSGTTTVSGLVQNRANIAELVVAGPAGRIEGAALRLYEPATHEWTLNYFNIRQGQLTPPVKGRFADGRGVFYGDDSLNGQPIKVRFVIMRVSDDEYRFEQAFSADSGQTWEINWIATDKRQAGWTPCPR